MIANDVLFHIATAHLHGQDALQKQAVVPPGGGAPPMDPAMGGGAPPMDPAMMGGAPPMDPAMMGGAPPMDPAMGGGAPPMSLAGDPMIQQIIAQTVEQVMGQGAGEAAGAKPKAAKIDPVIIDQKLTQLTRLMSHLVTELGIGMPANILDPPDAEGAEQAAPAAPVEAAPKLAEDVSNRGLAREVAPPQAATDTGDERSMLMDLARRAMARKV